MRPWETQKAWIQLDESSQASQAQGALTICCRFMGLQEDVQVIEVKDNDRFVLSYEQDPTKPDFGKHMIKLERLMKQALGVVVDLRLESKEDLAKRKKRRERMEDHRNPSTE